MAMSSGLVSFYFFTLLQISWQLGSCLSFLLENKPNLKLKARFFVHLFSIEMRKTNLWFKCLFLTLSVLFLIHFWSQEQGPRFESHTVFRVSYWSKYENVDGITQNWLRPDTNRWLSSCGLNINHCVTFLTYFCYIKTKYMRNQAPHTT